MVVWASQPERATARDLPGTLFGIITAPLGAILNRVDRAGRRIPYHRRPNTVRSRPPAPVAERSKPAPTAASADQKAAPTATTTAKAAGATAAGAAAVAATAASANASTQTDTAKPETPAAKEPTATAAVPIPNPAPEQQRSAALQAKDARARGNPSPRALGQTAQPSQRLGIVGPLAWPSAYEDVIGYTLWPKEYGERLRVHGIGDVLTTIFAPNVLASRARLSAAPGNTNVASTAAIEAAGACGATNPSSPDWPAAEIERTFKLEPAQSTALEALKAAVGLALTSIKATCRDEVALTPIERLRNMQGTLWAVHDAAIQIRAPLAKFYESLTDEQRKQFSAPASVDPRTMAAANPNMSRDDYARMCGMPKLNEASMRPVEQALRPTKPQQASLDSLQKKAFEMGQFLMASCLKPLPTTPAERLDAAADRLTAMIFATSNISLALNDLYNQLSDEQKTRMTAAFR
jgi:hypothetical protein